MIDLCISGSLDKDIMLFSLNNETKSIDQFSKDIHFFLKEHQTYRIHFEQRTADYIPRCAEIVLNVLFFPVRGVFNVMTFNIDQNWEKDISAFKISGYIDINLYEDTDISFKLKHGEFDKKTNSFRKPTISFSPNVLIEQLITSDTKEISKKHCNYLQNIASVSMLLFALLFYLLYAALNNRIYIAFVYTSIFVVVFGVLVAFLIRHSFKKKNRLLTNFANQQRKEHC